MSIVLGTWRASFRKDPEGKNAKRAKTSENFAEEKNVRRRYFRRFLRSHFYWIL